MGRSPLRSQQRASSTPADNALTHDSEPQPGFSTAASHTARTLTLTDLGDHLGAEQRHRAALQRWDPVEYRRVHVLTHTPTSATASPPGPR